MHWSLLVHKISYNKCIGDDRPAESQHGPRGRLLSGPLHILSLSPPLPSPPSHPPLLFLPSHPIPLLSPPFPPFPSLPSLPLEVGPLNPARGLGDSGGALQVSSPSGVWGGAPAEIEFGAF